MRVVRFLLLCDLFFCYHLSTYNLSHYVGRFVQKWNSPLAVGDWITYRTNKTDENRIAFGVDGNGIRAFFETYEGTDNRSDCYAAFDAIGYPDKSIQNMAAAYSNGDQYYTYVLFPKSSLDWVSATWSNVAIFAPREYEGWTSSFDLSDVLKNHVAQFRAWSDSFRDYMDPFGNLTAPDLGGLSFDRLTENPSDADFITSEKFFNLTNPSAVATRAWLMVKFALFKEFMGTGFTLPSNHSEPGLPEVIFTHRPIEVNDTLVNIGCSGRGFVQNSGVPAAVLTVFDAFEFYVDGVQLANGTTLDDSNKDVVVTFNKNARRFVIHAMDQGSDSNNGIIATVGKLVTDGTWSCQPGFNQLWTAPDFDFSGWPRAVARNADDPTADGDLVQQSPRAKYIWTEVEGDVEVTCLYAVPVITPKPTPADATPTASSPTSESLPPSPAAPTPGIVSESTTKRDTDLTGVIIGSSVFGVAVLFLSIFCFLRYQKRRKRVGTGLILNDGGDPLGSYYVAPPVR